MTQDDKRELQAEFARIAAIESHYWAEVDTDSHPTLRDIAIGAMGSAANICAAMLRGLTAEDFRKEVEKRDAKEFA